LNNQEIENNRHGRNIAQYAYLEVGEVVQMSAKQFAGINVVKNISIVSALWADVEGSPDAISRG
jgi:hypothetical protein